MGGQEGQRGNSSAFLTVNTGIVILRQVMSSITSFVSELVRAANEVERLNAFTISRLLERAVATIQDLRESAGIPSEGTQHDALNDLRHAANAASELGASDHAAALLNAET